MTGYRKNRRCLHRRCAQQPRPLKASASEWHILGEITPRSVDTCCLFCSMSTDLTPVHAFFQFLTIFAGGCLHFALSSSSPPLLLCLSCGWTANLPFSLFMVIRARASCGTPLSGYQHGALQHVSASVVACVCCKCSLPLTQTFAQQSRKLCTSLQQQHRPNKNEAASVAQGWQYTVHGIFPFSRRSCSSGYRSYAQ